MPQDAFTLKYLCEELNSVLSGGKINRIIQPKNESVEFTVYIGVKTVKFLIDVSPSCPRIGITEKGAEPLLTAPNFCMLLRKHLVNATIKSLGIVGFDRIVKIVFLDGTEFSCGEEKILFVELMGRYSNVILTQNGKVLGSSRGTNFFDNGVRPLIVGMPYILPPSNGKKEPKDETLIEYFNAFNGQNLAEYIASGVQGISLITAKEIEKRYLSSNEYDAQKLYCFLTDFIYNCKVNPCLNFNNGVPSDVFVFPYECVSQNYVYFPSLFLAEDFLFSEKETLKSYSELKNSLQSRVNSLIKKYKKKIAMLLARKKDAESADENRLKGEIILSNIYKISRGQNSAELFNYYDNQTIVVELDPALSAAQNAENYYKKYNKQKRTLKLIVPQIEEIQDEIDYLFSVSDEIELAESVQDLNSVKAELLSEGLIKEKRATNKKKKEEHAERVYLIKGFTVKCGKNNIENDSLTLGAKKEDVWVHVKDYHSSHVIIDSQKKAIPQEVIVNAAEICAYYSKARTGGKTEVVYTLKKNVKKPSGAKAGFFTYENYSSLFVEPQKHDELVKP